MTEPIPSTEQPLQQNKDAPAATEQSQQQQQPLKRHTEDQIDTRELKAPKLTVVEGSISPEAEADQLTSEFIVDDADENNMVDLSRASSVTDKMKSEASNGAKSQILQQSEVSSLSEVELKVEVEAEAEAAAPSADEDSVGQSKENGTIRQEPPQIIAPPPPPPGLHLLTPEQQQQLLQSTYHGGREFATTLAQAMITPVALPAGSGLPPSLLLQQMQQNGIIPLAGPPPQLKPHQTHSPQLSKQPSPSSSHQQEQLQQQAAPQASPSASSQASSSTSPQPSQINTATSSPTITNVNATASTSPLLNNNTNDKQRLNTRSLSNDEKRQRRLLRNRVAAKECRKKKKQHIQDMEQKILQLEDENKNLRNEVDELRAKLGMPSLATASIVTVSAAAPTTASVSTAPALKNHPAVASTTTPTTTGSIGIAPPPVVPTVNNVSKSPVLTTAPVIPHTQSTAAAVDTDPASSDAVMASPSPAAATQNNDSLSKNASSLEMDMDNIAKDVDKVKELNTDLITNQSSTATSKESKDVSIQDSSDEFKEAFDNDIVLNDVEPPANTTSGTATSITAIAAEES